MFVFTRDYAGRRRISKRIPGRSDCTVMRGTPGALCRSGSGGVGAPDRIRQFPDGDSRDHHQKGTRNMAQQTTVTLTDDLDGGKAAETVTFGLDGRIYEIDLSKKNATALRKVLGEFTGSARRVRSGRPAATARASRSSDRVDAKAVREWAQAQGIAVSARGRVPAEIVEQYQAAAD